MTDTQAFAIALWLAVTTDLDEDSQMATELANQLKSRLTQKEIDLAKVWVEMKLEAANVH